MLRGNGRGLSFWSRHGGGWQVSAAEEGVTGGIHDARLDREAPCGRMTAEVRVNGESRITTVTPIIDHSRRLADCAGLAETERLGVDPAKRGVLGGWTQEKAQQLMLRGDGAE